EADELRSLYSASWASIRPIRAC
ncbi:hypothetical protein PC121_g25553, partial [Phytophthora cactorum]